jgi:hypothetical protein
MSALKNACYAVVDSFTDLPGSDVKRREAYTELIATLLSFIIAITLLAFIGKWLWNNVIVDLFSFAKPARTIWQVLGLAIFVSLIK